MATIGKYCDVPVYIPAYSVIFRHSGFSQRPLARVRAIRTSARETRYRSDANVLSYLKNYPSYEFIGEVILKINIV
jgi:hypothetical protein